MKKNRKLKGSVLFTVVSVMALLIIFLTSTLVLAMSSNRRAHRSYSTSQAEITAKSVIESFMTSVNRNEAMRAAMINLSGATYPTVTLNDSSLGTLLRYDSTGAVHENEISIEPVTTSQKQYVYVETNEKKADGTNKWVWQEARVFKISATVQVGKDEKTVVAYVRNKAPSEPGGTEIIGLQTAGKNDNAGDTSGYYSGAAVFGITEDIDATLGSKTKFKSSADTIFDTSITFVNGNFEAGSNGVHIKVRAPKTGTVILGDLTTQNAQLVDVNYEPSSTGFTQQDIPYLFVEGNISGTSVDLSIGNTGSNNAPFNVFAGSVNLRQAQIHADLYLMDADKESTLGGETTKLWDWSYSVANKTNTQNYSEGGSVFCRGNLALKDKAEINGDVYVAGDLRLAAGEAAKKPVIHGDVYVGGDLYIENAYQIDGNIYRSSTSKVYNSTAGVNSNYKKVNNIHHDATDVVRDDCIEVNNNKIEYFEFKAQNYGDAFKVIPDPSQPWVNYYVDPFGNEIDEPWTPRYYKWRGDYVPNGSETAEYVRDNNLLVDTDSVKGWSRPAAYWGKTNVVDNGDGTYSLVATSIPTDYEKYYYDPASGAELQEDELHTRTDAYYTRADFDGNDTGIFTSAEYWWAKIDDHSEVTEYEATHTTTEDTSISTTVYSGEFYPSKMTKEAIYGKYNQVTGAWEVDPATKIITNMEEIRKQIGAEKDPMTGEASFDNSKYPTTLDELGITEDEVKLYNGNGNANGSTIVDSCTITSVSSDTTIKSESGKTLYIRLKNLTLEKTLTVNPNGGSIRFFLEGTTTLKTGSCKGIIASDVHDGMTVDQSYKPDILYYGAVGSKLILENNHTVVGQFRCPETYFEAACSQGPFSVNYVSPTGYTSTFNPTIIGNALFSSLKTNNNFRLAYSPIGNDVVTTPSGDGGKSVNFYEVAYFEAG